MQCKHKFRLPIPFLEELKLQSTLFTPVPSQRPSLHLFLSPFQNPHPSHYEYHLVAANSSYPNPQQSSPNQQPRSKTDLATTNVRLVIVP